MFSSVNLPKVLVISFAVLGIGIFVWRQYGGPGNSGTKDLTIPQFSEVALAGEQAYKKTCAQCHGVDAVGTASGPPLLHDIYNPGHHGDMAFVLAAQRGVQSHHWQFGDMPPQPGVSEKDLAAIVRYVRELQLANGILYRKHRM